MGKKSKKEYNGDGTASLSDSYQALWHNMKEQGLDPETTPLFQVNVEHSYVKFDRINLNQDAGKSENTEQTEHQEMKNMAEEKETKIGDSKEKKAAFEKSIYDWTITSYWGAEPFEF